MGQQNTKSFISIKVLSSQTESHELFDFHHGGVQRVQKIIKSPSFLVNDGETVKLTNGESYYNLEQKIPNNAIYRICQDDYQQISIRHLGSEQSKTLWRVIKPGQSYSLKIGDILKIGKIKAELKKVVYANNERTSDEITQNDVMQIHSPKIDTKSMNSNHSESNRCRLCFQSSNTKTDPLVCLCNCSGSIKFIHFQCLKDWVTNNIQKREEENCKFYTYEEICCQLCKHNLPNSFRHQGKEYSFFQVNFQPPYAQFQSTEEDQNGKRKFHKYVINLFEHKEVTIGRNNSCQVVMKDISISRVHCSLEYKQGMVIVRDKKSKFGTLVKVDRALQFNMQAGLKLQFESMVIELYRKHRLKGCCCSDSDIFRLVYETDNKSKNMNSNVTRERNQDQLDSVSFEEIQVEEISHQQQGGESRLGQTSKRNQLSQTRAERFVSPRSTMIRATVGRNGTVRY